MYAVPYNHFSDSIKSGNRLSGIRLGGRYSVNVYDNMAMTVRWIMAISVFRSNIEHYSIQLTLGS